MTLLAIIDYALIVLFFIGVACLLFLSVQPRPQAAKTQVVVPQASEMPGTYLFLAAIFLLVFVTALARKYYGQSAYPGKQSHFPK